MNTCIAILRGINVSGQKKILMSDLKALFEGLNFKDVETYIQSGNVIFKTERPAGSKELATAIEKAIAAQYPFEVPVIVRTADEMAATIRNNPLAQETGIDPEKLHVTFLGEAPDAAKVEAIRTSSYPPDRFVILGQDVFLYCEKYGETKLSNAFFESKLKVSATTRNWKTVNKLMELAIAKL